MLLTLLLCLIAATQADERFRPSPFDREIALELTADEPLRFDYISEFEGYLHVWTRSGLDLALRIEEPGVDRLPAKDDNSGGGTTPYLQLNVKVGDRFAVFIAGAEDADRAVGGLTLHLIAAPETQATHEAATAGKEALRLAHILLKQGDLKQAREVLEPVFSMFQETVGAEYSQRIADSLLDLGTSARNAGMASAFRKALTLVAAHDTRTLPADHPIRLSTRQNLAVSMWAMGDLAGARALLESVLEGYERTRPAEALDLLRTRQNLATFMDEMGDLASARVLLESVLEVYERTLPPDHPDLLACRSNLAKSMKSMGDPAGARALQESVLEARERTLPADHLQILLIRSNLANSMKRMGDPEGARALLESVLESYERTLPADHADISSTRMSLANTMKATGDREGARALLESVNEVYERTLPPDHPTLLRARSSLAGSLDDDLEGAYALYDSVLEARERTLSSDDPELLCARINVCIVLSELGDLDGAQALLHRQCAGMQERILASLSLAPRQVRQVVADGDHLLNFVYCLSETAAPALRYAVFELTETMRLVAGEAARSLGKFDADPELGPIIAAADRLRREQGDLIASGSPNGEDSEATAAKLTRLSLERDRVERDASRLLAERGVVAQPLEAQVDARVRGSLHSLGNVGGGLFDGLAKGLLGRLFARAIPHLLAAGKDTAQNGIDLYFGHIETTELVAGLGLRRVHLPPPPDLSLNDQVDACQFCV